uniref:Transposase n=1 Tax=Globodera rostochiensis TaxID=31243 RepID=A0A914H579_GLORO
MLHFCYKWTVGGKKEDYGRLLMFVQDVRRKCQVMPNCRHGRSVKEESGPTRGLIEAELALGPRENTASAKVRIECRVAQKYSDKPNDERTKIRDHACCNARATKKALYRAQKKRTKNIRTLQQLRRAESFPLWMGSDHYQELFMLHCSDELTIFSSPRQLALIKKSATIVSDGTFKMSPKGIFQVYRVFGFVGQTYALPLVTALMRGKTGVIYSRFWTKLREELNGVPGDLLISLANFDCEPASVNAFCVAFPERMGYMELYSSRDQNGIEFQRIVRKIGALQFCPPNYVRRSLHLIRNQIGQTPLEIAQKAALNEILDYYDTIYVDSKQLGPAVFFNHFDVSKHRTINHAESYHGRWLANFQELSRQPPPRPFADTEEIDGEIARQKQHITNFLNTDFDEDQFNEAMAQYYGRIGSLIGFNPVRRAGTDPYSLLANSLFTLFAFDPIRFRGIYRRAEVEKIMMNESAREMAEASLDENGLLAALSGRPSSEKGRRA